MKTIRIILSLSFLIFVLHSCGKKAEYSHESTTSNLDTPDYKTTDKTRFLLH